MDEIDQVAFFIYAMVTPDLELDDGEMMIVSSIGSKLAQDLKASLKLNETSDNREMVLESLKVGLHSNNLYTVCVANSILYYISSEVLYLKELTRALKKYDCQYFTQNIDNLIALSSILFLPNVEQKEQQKEYIDRGLLQKILTAAVDNGQQILIANDAVPEEKFVKNDRIVIITQQFITPPHAPSQDVLVFAEMFTRDYNKEVLIVSTCEVGGAQNGCVLPNFQAGVQFDYSSLNTITYNGLTFGLYQHTDAYMSPENLLGCSKAINDFEPEMILTVGTRNVVAEMFYKSAFLMMYPISRGIPTTIHHHFHTWDAPDDDMKQIVQNENLEEYYLFAQHPGFNPKIASMILTREEFDLPNDAYVFAVIGMRLQHEVELDFLEMLEKIVAHENAYIAFIGNYPTYNDVMKDRTILKEKTRYLGFHKDVMSVLSLCDATINMKRIGGGSGVVDGLSAGLPALSLPYGDGGMAVDIFPLIEDYDGIVRVALDLCCNAKTREAYDEYTKLSCDKYCSREPLVTKIMHAFDNHCTKNNLT